MNQNSLNRLKFGFFIIYNYIKLYLYIFEMSISFVSDLHYESNKFVDLKNIDNSDVLILCGDIITVNK